MAEEEAARRLKDLQALSRSNSALRCLLSLQSRRSAADMCRKASGGQPVPELSERFERLIEVVKRLQHDLRLERKKSKLRRSRQLHADVAIFLVFLVGNLAILTAFEPGFPVALRDYVYCQVYKLRYTW